MKYKKIDAHAHIYPAPIAAKANENLGHFYNFDVHCAGTYYDLERQLVENEFNGVFLLSVATSAKQVEKVNDTGAEALRLAKAHGLEAYSFMAMHQDYENMAAEVARGKELGFTGVKIHPDIQAVNIDDDRFMKLYETIEGKMPLFLHMGDNRPEYQYSHAERLAKILQMFPQLKVIAAHFGSYRAWDNAQCLYGHKNVWYDLSSSLWCLTPAHAKELIERCGYDRVMFGTDYPIYSLKDYEEMFAKIDLTDAQRADIYYYNAQRFLEA
ncbi:MAG: amidohydrolase family protein [Clostridiales bacterium]|nr:amidohydrolase family protein [Clostridiales bacterium]